jgi:hypothetical protein
MHPYSALLFVLAALTAAAILTTVKMFVFPAHTTAGKIGALMLLICTLPGAMFLGAWTAAAVQSPTPTEVTWENVAQNPEAGWWNRQVAWAGLQTGWIQPEVTPGFFYSTATAGEGDEQISLVALPGTKWYRL